MKKPIIVLMIDYFVRMEDKSWLTNEWLYGLEMEIYVRKGYHVLNGENITTCLDIANVTVYEKGQGIFTTFLKCMERLQPWEAIYVESVQTNRFCSFLEKQGYNRLPDSNSYYKIK